MFFKPPVVSESEVEFVAIRAQGAGGQNVNKVSSAVHLRFDVRASSLPPEIQAQLLALNDRRLNKDGVIVIKAQTSRSQDQNRTDAMERLNALVAAVSKPIVVRKPTRPSLGAKRRRLESKTLRGQVKALRGPVKGIT
ncbi:MAG: alternative ribosome rescue aminoacyl-tRNA hydrolase ArfB [Limnobacter sp.]|nr:alternative ribosome rescue aminoacyl-tRNA hydrolase ArfB [Limnobacter sp.]